MPSSPLFSPEMSRPEAPQRRVSPAELVDLSQYTLQDLLLLRGAIEKRLPARTLADMNLERELILQFLATQELQSSAADDENTPLNQRAQAMNATAAILQQLVKLQESVHNSERLKRIESKLVEALNTLPSSTQEAFLEVYELLLRGTDPAEDAGG